MNVPESWTERLPLLEVLKQSWRPVPRAVLLFTSAFYAVFLIQAARAGSGLAQWMDLVFIPIHEAGHLLFGFFGEFSSRCRRHIAADRRASGTRFLFHPVPPGAGHGILFVFLL
jgi:hypothetical protein